MSSPGETLHGDIDGGWILPPPAVRRALHTRSIVCRSFKRDDGLFEIDGRFIDTRPFEYTSPHRGLCQAGSALHNMQLRLTLDSQRVVHDVVSAMPGTPYTTCSEVNANFQRLRGMSIGRGFRQALRERLGGVEGCTHVLALLDAMAAAAVQTFASNANQPRQSGQADQAEPVRMWKIDALIDTCYSYRADGPLVQSLKVG